MELVGNHDGYVIWPTAEKSAGVRAAWKALRAIDPKFPREYLNKDAATIAAARASSLSGHHFEVCEALL